MADSEASPAVESSSNSPAPKRVKKSSPTPESETKDIPEQTPLPAESKTQQQQAAPEVATDITTETLPEDDQLEADDDFASDSGFGSDASDSTSISSSIYAGYVENGRRYQTKREGEYWGPSDEKQFEAMQAAHLVQLILDSKHGNHLFRSPIPDTVQNILDVGTGNGAWAVEVADKYPGAVITGIDLFPPPNTWVPPNCKFEVDDVLKSWEFKNKWDFVHMRDMFGAFTDRQWTGVYKQAYENLVPGGWIEQVEPGVFFYSDDGTLPADSLLAAWGPIAAQTCAKSGKNIDTIDHFKDRITAAGFTNLHEKLYKVPLGTWSKNLMLKEAGKFHKLQLLGGMEGYFMFVMTKFGEPEPWTPEEVHVFLAKVRKEIENPDIHAYVFRRRVWAQKPLDSEPEIEQKAEVETLA